MSDETPDKGEATPPAKNPWLRDPDGTASAPVAGEETAPTGDDIRPQYAASGRDLFWKAWRMMLWTVLTAGIYRFWMRTALRRHYWGGIKIQGDPLEYTGRGLEKLLGFLIALAILAVVLGALNVALTFAGISLASDDPVQANLAFQLSVLATLPLIAYARYRGLQYMLSRTRWRGIRFN